MLLHTHAQHEQGQSSPKTQKYACQKKHQLRTNKHNSLINNPKQKTA